MEERSGASVVEARRDSRMFACWHRRDARRLHARQTLGGVTRPWSTLESRERRRAAQPRPGVPQCSCLGMKVGPAAVHVPLGRHPLLTARSEELVDPVEASAADKDVRTIDVEPIRGGLCVTDGAGGAVRCP